MTHTRQFTLTAPDGSVIARGSLDALMERLPDTHARDAALESMLRTAAEAVEAEQRREEALASSVQMISDTVAHLTNRMDAYIERREEQRQQDAEQAEREEQAEIEAYLDQLPDPDSPATYVPGGELHDLSPSVLDEDDQGPNSNLEMRPVNNLEELAHGPKQPGQPIAISLNEQEE
jgi:hypothetical protein